MKYLNSALFFGTTASTAFALTASDDASNYATWNDTDNQGTGFAAWSLNDNNGSVEAGAVSVFAGNFLGDSTVNSGAGDINTTGQSFGMYANQDVTSTVNAFSTAIRSFDSTLNTNDQFTFQLALNYDNGNKGFNIRHNGDTVFGFDIGTGARINVGGNYTDSSNIAIYEYGGTSLIDVTILITSANSLNYQISRTSAEGTQGMLFSGSVAGIAAQTIEINNFEFYVSATDNGDAQNNLYVNSLSVSEVPEPSAYALFAGLAAITLTLSGRRVSATQPLSC